MVLGWLAGVGALNYPLVKILGREPLPDIPKQSWTRYFRFTLDHKVVGVQYLVAVFTFLFTGGLLAILHPPATSSGRGPISTSLVSTAPS
jgi:cytochrome c oxidase subunit 1